MKIKGFICDVCLKEIREKSWEDAPSRLEIYTHMSSCNPIGKINGQYQGNTLKFEEVCGDCQRTVANAVFAVISKLLPSFKNEDQRISRTIR